jgi:putative transposase
MVGLDLGLVSFVVTSDGEEIANPKYYRRDEKKLARAQRMHARKKKGSKNREKARKKVARLHARITDRRRDYQHQLSTRITHENQVICVESLAVKNLVKNHALAKSISDVGWGEFVRQLDYKATWYGRTLVKIDRWFPSTKTCHVCQHILPELDLSIREWVCPNCRTVHQRDHNAAKNVLTEGLSVAACGGSIRRDEVRASRAAPVEAGNSGRETRSPAL